MIEQAMVRMRDLDGGDIFILTIAGICGIVLFVVCLCSVVVEGKDDDFSGGS